MKVKEPINLLSMHFIRINDELTYQRGLISSYYPFDAQRKERRKIIINAVKGSYDEI